MTRKNPTWAMLGLCGSLLLAAVPIATQAADPAVSEQATASNAGQNEVTCRDLHRPGSRIKERICGTPAERAAVLAFLSLAREENVAGSSSLSKKSARGWP
jgi:hypothetical protein